MPIKNYSFFDLNKTACAKKAKRKDTRNGMNIFPEYCIYQPKREFYMTGTLYVLVPVNPLCCNKSCYTNKLTVNINTANNYSAPEMTLKMCWSFYLMVN